MFKKVLGSLVVLSLVIGGGTVLQVMGEESDKGKDQVKETIKKKQEKSENEVVSKQKALEKARAEIREKLRKRYERKGLSKDEIEKKVEVDLSLTEDQTVLLEVPKQIEKLKKMMEKGSLFSPSEEERVLIDFYLSDIGRAMDSRAIPILIEMVKKCEDDELRERGVGGLGATGIGEEAVVIPILKDALKDKSERVRLRSALSLIDLGETSSSCQSLIKLYRSKDKNIRWWAIYGLGEILEEIDNKEPKVVAKTCIKEALNDEDWQVRIESAHILIKMGEDKKIVLPTIERNLKDGDDFVRKDAIGVLVAIGDKESVLVIKDYLNKDESEYVQRGALMALERLAKEGNKDAFAVLKESLQHKNSDIRVRAKEMLERLNKKP